MNENGRFLFLLNHGEGELRVKLDRDGTEIIENQDYQAEDEILIRAKDVKIIRR